MQERETWDSWYMNLAKFWARRSKDPSTKVGAVIVRPDKTQSSVGYNGFPRGVHDINERYDNRALKYEIVVHAELNAILNAREPLTGHTIYCTLEPCSRCAAAIIQAGITEVVVMDEPVPERWTENMKISRKILSEGGVNIRRIKCEPVAA